jgi:hypothetical protein
MTRRSLKPGQAKAQAEAPADDRQRLYPLANQIRTAYILAYRAHFLARHGVPSQFGSGPMPRWDGGEAADGRTYQPIWYRIARVALEHEVAPDDLIAGAFHNWDAKDPPWPTNLIGAEAIAYAVRHPGIAVDDTRRALEVQKDIWRIRIFLYMEDRGCDFAAAARACLRNRRLELSSIFRYCMAVDGGDAETAALFEAGALNQYLFNRRAYDQGWGELIPAALRSAADLFHMA